VSSDPERRLAILERELWRIAVENLNHSEQHAWAALAGARVAPNGWRRAKAMLQHDQTRDLRKRFLLTCVQRNRNHQLRLKALGEIAALRDPDAFDDAVDVVGTWPRDERRAGTRVLLQALAERRIGRRDQAQAWVWRLASYSRELHEEYAVQRWPETKRLLGLFVNSSGRAHGRNARRIVHAARQHDRRLAVALLAAAVAHTPEAEEALRGARMRMARKPSAVARELLRNFPRSGGKRRRQRRRKKGRGSQVEGNGAEAPENGEADEVVADASENGPGASEDEPEAGGEPDADEDSESEAAATS
jgi:ribonuclease E